MKRIIIFSSIVFLFALLSGCAASLENVKIEKVTICENQRCRYLTDADSKEELLVKIFNLLKGAEDKDSELFKSDPKSRTFEKKGISFFVQGGPIPGKATRTSTKFTDVLYIDRENMEIKFKVLDKQTWLAIPVITATAEGILSMKSLTEIKVNYSGFASGMVVGASGQSTEWLIDYIDLDNKVLGAHYAISVAGLGFGGGSGYQLVKLKEGEIKQKALAVADTKTIPEPKKVAPPAITIEPPKIIPPALFANVAFTEASGNRILEGGEEAILRVEVQNKGGGTAKDVQVILSGNQMLVNYLGEKKSIGDIGAKEKKTVEFKAVLPLQIPSGEMDIKIEIKEVQGFSPSETKILKIAAKQAERKETVEVISEIPRLVFSTYLKDQNNNRVLDGGEEVSLKVTVENKGEGAAKDVQVILSGNKTLTDYLGEKRFVGDIKPGEKKTAEFRAVLPARIPSEAAMLKIELKEAMGTSSSEVKILKVAMRPKEIKEVVEVISEINVDDIPLKTKNFERKDAFALVIGISKYREEAIPAVKYASRDAEIVAKYLENVGGIPRNNIKLLTYVSVTKSDLEAYIGDWLARRVGKDSTVFVYYAGHGAPDVESKEAYIAPYEGHPDFPSKLYSLKRMYEALNKLPAREVIVMLDSCFSGTGGRSITKSGARPLVISIENPVLASGKINVLAASTGSQISSDYDSVKHGLFTYFFLRGMRGEADKNANSIIELGELYDYVKTNVSERASLELNRDQTPVLLPSTDTADNRLKMPVAKIK
ncbi:MAG: caspase family protein [Thermodesulfovibrionales bacterium]|nr:caspase family protein [Thermodesulfovibrionales bacterium]